ncbi:MAG: RES family NAD+ phosphorylase [Deltaproteobacteria bacterium]|nr:RES family NAD+ phosphorylase [Deltaproteobacteria bacterium]
MVKIGNPPPAGKIKPKHYTLPGNSKVLRIFNRHSEYPFSIFRNFGPLYRFDHHIHDHTVWNFPPKHNPDRAVCYVSPDFATCLVEVFGRTGIVEAGYDLIDLEIKEDLYLLDLRDNGGELASGCVGVSSIPDVSHTQLWSRYIYDDPARQYGPVEGIIYPSAWGTGGDNIVLWERADGKLSLSNRAALDEPNHPKIRKMLLDAAVDTRMTVSY